MAPENYSSYFQKWATVSPRLSDMLYILPPPAAPTPPSPWPSILCSSNRNKLRKTSSDGIVNDPWVAVTSQIGPSNKRPPRSHSLRIRSKKKVSGEILTKIDQIVCVRPVY